jgi:hypothetical protein
LAAFRGYTLHQGHRVIRLKDLCFQLTHPTVQTKNRRLTNNNMNVARTLLYASLQKFINENGGHDSFIEKGSEAGFAQHAHSDMRNAQ